MLHTTFALAKQAGACKPSYRRYAEHVGGVRRYGRHTPIPLVDILDVLGLEDALWCLRCVLPEQSSERDRLATLLAADYAEHVAYLWIAPSGVIWQPSDTLSVVRRYADGLATHDEMRAAEEAAWTAEGMAWEAARTVWEAARTAGAAEGMAWEAARTAWEAARTAGTARTAARTAWEAARTAGTAEGMAWEAARTAGAAREARETAREAERSWQAQRLRERLTEEAE